MALHWSVQDCEDHEELITDSEWAITHHLIWMTVFVDMGRITESNYIEFCARTRLVEKMTGMMVREDVDGKLEDVPTELEWVRRRIGLSTNVFTIEGRTKWIKKFFGNQLDLEIERLQREAKDEVER